MKNNGLLNAKLDSVIAKMRHTDYLAIVDIGTPVPEGINEIDLSLISGVPSFRQVLEAVLQELVVESYVYASEVKQCNEKLYEDICMRLNTYSSHEVSHKELKEMISKAKCVVRTGERTPYANVVLVCGVDF